MVIADETDEAANAKWEHYKAGTDLKRWPTAMPRLRMIPAPIFTPSQSAAILGTNKLPTNQGVLVGSYASVARMLDELPWFRACRA